MSYRELLHVHGFARLAAASFLARVANEVFVVTLVLFVLARFGSPELVGLTVSMSVLPGLLISPLAGALLDRHGCTRLILLDFAVSAATMVLLPAMALTGLLAPWMLVGVVALNSLTSPFTRTGARSLIPRLVPRGLWDRANAVDAASYAVSSILGPVLAGLLVAWVQGEGALLATSAVFGLAGLCLVGLRDQAVAAPRRGSLAAEARAGLGYVLANPSLRGLVLVSAGYNFSHGVLSLVLPIMVLQRLGHDAALVGVLFGVQGVANLLSGLACGRMNSDGQERNLMGIGLVGSAAALLILAGSGGLAAMLAALVLHGLANGPMNIGLFALRQRRTDPEWLGRALAVSASLNYAGFPLGSAAAGALVGGSIAAALGLGALAALAAAASLPAIPRARTPEKGVIRVA